MLPRLRDTIEDLRRSLQPKEEALESLQLSLAEKEQVHTNYPCILIWGGGGVI